jgi:hypothetical protein
VETFHQVSPLVTGFGAAVSEADPVFGFDLERRTPDGRALQWKVAEADAIHFRELGVVRVSYLLGILGQVTLKEPSQWPNQACSY